MEEPEEGRAVSRILAREHLCQLQDLDKHEKKCKNAVLVVMHTSAVFENVDNIHSGMIRFCTPLKL